jgi:hypothetical protein
MPNVVHIDFAVHWEKPVHVGKGDLLDQVIRGPAEAIRYIDDHLDERGRKHYCKAWHLCHCALRGEVSLALSRQAFLIAFAASSMIAMFPECF